MNSFALRLAVLPSFLLLLFVVGKNKKRRNPTSLLVWLAVLGAVSVIPAAIVELLGSGFLIILGLDPDSTSYVFIECFFIIAMIEELGKFLVMLILTWKNKNFDHSYDGVIYGVCSSLGFATLENILYVFQGGIGTGVMRAFSAVPLHCSCGVIMGFFYAKAREWGNKDDGSGVFVNLLLAYVCPLGLHGLYDFVLSADDISEGVCWVVLAIAVILMFFLISFGARQDHIIASQPIWTAPYNFRYMPGGYGQQVNYGQSNSYYGQQANYGQPNGYYGQQANYGQQNGYGQQANYGQPNSYYGQQANYGQPNNYYGQQANYNQPNGYSQPNNYGQQQNYNQPNYNQPNYYGQQTDHDQQNGYGQTNNNYKQR